MRLVSVLWLLAGSAAAGAAEEESFQPVLATEKTRASREALAALERPGTVFFTDDFETPESLKKYFLEAAPAERLALERNRWTCLELMIRANEPGRAGGELAAWIDGKLYVHYTGFRWRSAPQVKLKRFSLGLYVHQAAKENTVWYDDMALSTGYIGPMK